MQSTTDENGVVTMLTTRAPEIRALTMDDGSVVQVPPGYLSCYGPEYAGEGLPPYLFIYPNGAELEITRWDGSVAGINVKDLADGASWDDLGVSRRGDTYTYRDGSTWTRYGDEMVVWTPGEGESQGRLART